MLLRAASVQANEVQLVSSAAGSPGVQTANGASAPDAISVEGRWVAFSSQASDLVASQIDANGSGSGDVYLYDRVTKLQTLVSHAAGSPATTGNGDSHSALLSFDGRFTLFESTAVNLVPGQTSSGQTGDVYLYDRADGTTLLVSRKLGDPALGTGNSHGTSALNADGSYAAWASKASDVVQLDADVNGAAPDVYLFDRAAGTATLVSHQAGSPLRTSDGSSFGPSLSNDGRYVAFVSTATNLVGGQTENNAGLDLFLHDRVTGATALVSRAANSIASTANNVTGEAIVTDSGLFVVFESAAANLIPGQIDTNGDFDIFLYDRQSRETVLVSHASGSVKTAGNGRSGSFAVSSDGRWVAYQSFATDLVAGVTDANSQGDVFLYDRWSGTTSLLSRSSLAPDATANAGSGSPRISWDGTRVTFASDATDLVPGQDDDNSAPDVFLHDPAAGTTALASRTLASEVQTGNGASSGALLSGDGRTVAFLSQASDFAPADANGMADAFVSAAPPGSFFTMRPCRLLDTRRPQDAPAFASEATEILTLHGACGIPATARAVAVNVTVTQPTGTGHLTLYTGDALPPVASTINFGAGQTRANNAILSLATDGTGTLAARPVIAGNGSVHVILDVVGYFE